MNMSMTAVKPVYRVHCGEVKNFTMTLDRDMYYKTGQDNNNSCQYHGENLFWFSRKMLGCYHKC